MSNVVSESFKDVRVLTLSRSEVVDLCCAISLSIRNSYLNSAEQYIFYKVRDFLRYCSDDVDFVDNDDLRG